MSVTRFGVSMEKELLDALDDYVKENSFSNRSQAVRRLVSDNLTVKKWKCNNIVAGSVTLVYNHHKSDIQIMLTDLQHDYHKLILSSQHFHLDNEQCLEIIAVKGKAKELTELADKLIAIKGIQHGKLSMSRVD
ncbi:MAG: nickel-responsive transcriptional regulator NikR [Bacteroidales bacterium]|jgi:CopG family nickel-responsive transcriptional regulator|nr:nickel-responsive transcriptional regulator NikR [Bacteroidales bacterium]